ncbi:hypothetical protein FB107DRAFT_276047 [Schizophyllum commune]
MVSPRNDARGPYIPPVNRLPPELLSLIFYEALPQQLASATLHPWFIPLVVSAVCNYWRIVAIDAPELWQWISLTSCRSRREHHSRKLARLFVHRAKRTGLSIFYQDVEALSVTDDYLNVVILERGIQAIPHSERCYCAVDFIMANIAEIRVLELSIGHASIQRLSMLPPSAAKSLRNLRISLLEGGVEVQSLGSLLSTSPQLRFLSWSSYFSICEAPLPTTISWSQLVRVELDESVMPFSTFYDVLITGKSLREVWVRLTHGARPRGLDACRVSHYALEKIQIYGDEPLDDIFCALHLPALHDLTLRFESTRLTRSAEWPCAKPQSLRHFIANGITSLNSLYVSPGGTIEEETLIAIMALPSMASLKRLHVDISSVGDQVFESLSPGHRARVPFLPHLSTLTIGQCTTSDGVIAKMLRRRMRYRFPLQQMKIRFMRKEEGRHPMDMAQFQRAQQAGVFAEGCY